MRRDEAETRQDEDEGRPKTHKSSKSSSNERPTSATKGNKRSARPSNKNYMKTFKAKGEMPPS